ncbi:hypothetical protein [Microbulbifer sp. TRSA007]|uniref:hypothetical protein n=1 Tax=Microbulbifer sp. TRSA007 TaxID=3243384 RepID=UPI004039F82C
MGKAAIMHLRILLNTVLLIFLFPPCLFLESVTETEILQISEKRKFRVHNTTYNLIAIWQIILAHFVRPATPYDMVQKLDALALIHLKQPTAMASIDWANFRSILTGE